MSWLGDAMKTVKSVVLLRSKVERLEKEMEKSNGDVREIVGITIKLNQRLARVEGYLDAQAAFDGRPALPRARDD